MKKDLEMRRQGVEVTGETATRQAATQAKEIGFCGSSMTLGQGLGFPGGISSGRGIIFGKNQLVQGEKELLFVKNELVFHGK